jgi:hypothetical protein
MSLLADGRPTRVSRELSNVSAHLKREVEKFLDSVCAA